jgi:rhodanese-related sulfurtransferase
MHLHELKQLLKSKKVMILDVRSREEYEEIHIPGAVNVPLDQLVDWSITNGTDELVLTVCGKGGGRSEQGVIKLRELGFKAVFLEGGTYGWK